MNKKLQKSVLKQLDVSLKEFKANISDYRDASAGISGFIYHNETHAFAMKNQSLIVELLNEMADNLGEDVATMVGGFGIFRRDTISKKDKQDLYNFLGGNKKTEQGAITNVLAWLCVEQLAFELDNN
jgi:hypothetical protein